jgi:translation initiation factor 1
MADKSNDTLVYSSEHGRMCPECGEPVKRCRCGEAEKAAVRGDGDVRVRYEVAGRKGKGVTVISGLPLNDPQLRALAKTLKQKCGTGGSVKNGVIEIQGDHCVQIRDELYKLGRGES